MNQPLMPLPSSGARRRIGLGDEHVAVRQHVEPARMIEVRPRSWSPSCRWRPTGCCSPLQPLAGATFTVGMTFDSGCGSVGLEPLPASIGCLLGVPPQAARSVSVAKNVRDLLSTIVDLRLSLQ